MKYDLTPVPQASTVEIGTACTRRCAGCAFAETRIEEMTSDEMIETIKTLSHYWDFIGNNPAQYQLIGPRIVEFIGGAGQMNRLSREELKSVVRTARECNLSHVAFLCDAEKDKRAIKELFEVHHELNQEEGESSTKAVVALSVDAWYKESPTSHREHKSNVSWEMLRSKNEYIKDHTRQNFRVFCTIGSQNLEEIPSISSEVLGMAKEVLDSGSLLFVAPLTIHSPEVLAKTKISGRLLMGSDTSILLKEEHRTPMEKVVEALRKLKAAYSATFLNVEGTFENMLACCKPVEAPFQANCKDRCQFTTKDGQKLVATPNIRVMSRKGLKLGICTCFIGPTSRPDNYANTPLSALKDITEGKGSVEEIYEKLDRDLEEVGCPGCNCRTSIEIARGQGLL